jgi:allantoinase
MSDCFDVMYAEAATSAKLMSLALHDRLSRRPGGITGLIRFLDHVAKHESVRICTGAEGAAHWRKEHPVP